MNLENIRRHELDIQEESGYSVNDLDTTMENGSLDNSRILTGKDWSLTFGVDSLLSSIWEAVQLYLKLVKYLGSSKNCCI